MNEYLLPKKPLICRLHIVGILVLGDVIQTDALVPRALDRFDRLAILIVHRARHASGRLPREVRVGMVLQLALVCTCR